MKTIFHKAITTYFLVCSLLSMKAQTGAISGQIISNGKLVEGASITLLKTRAGSTSDTSGNYMVHKISAGKYKVRVTSVGYHSVEKITSVIGDDTVDLNFDLTNLQNSLNEVVVTGTLKEVRHLESPVPVEVYTPTYFKKNPTPNIYEALQIVNGVRPQLNCNVCNTGDIHINGLEGPYTLVLIDGMPLVSSLSTVYGLSGIPNSLIERIEVVKGPASSLYGSEAVGGLINIITKKPQQALRFSAEVFGTGWGEINADVGFKFRAGKTSTVLAGINYFNFQNKIDNNGDNFTDMTLQNRISLFQKWNVNRKDNRLFTIASRYMYEDRWGGDLQWNKSFRGGDSIYGESIYTKRWEFIGNYQLPTVEKLMLSFSYNNHDQDSRYGKTSYIARQKIGFTQLTWDKKTGINDLLAGVAVRYTYYDDNTPATSGSDTSKAINQPRKTWLPGIFIQNEMNLSKNIRCCWVSGMIIIPFTALSTHHVSRIDGVRMITISFALMREQDTGL